MDDTNAKTSMVIDACGVPTHIGTDEEFIKIIVEEIRSAFADAKHRYGDRLFLRQCRVTFVSPEHVGENPDACILTGNISLDGRNRSSRYDGCGVIELNFSDMPIELSRQFYDDM